MDVNTTTLDSGVTAGAGLGTSTSDPVTGLAGTGAGMADTTHSPPTDVEESAPDSGWDGTPEPDAAASANTPETDTENIAWLDPTVMPTHEEFVALNKAANEGDTAALETLRQLLDHNSCIWKHVGDLSAHAELALITLIAGDDQLGAESLRRSIDDLKTRLGAPTTTKLEDLAIGRVVATWLQLQHVDKLLINSSPGSVQANFLLKRQGQCSRQFDASMKSLATLRKLLPASSNPVTTPEPVTRAAPPSDSAPQHSGGVVIPITPYLESGNAGQAPAARAAGP